MSKIVSLRTYPKLCRIFVAENSYQRTATSVVEREENGAIVNERSVPILDLITAVLGKISDNAFKLKVEINGLMDTGQHTTPYALKKHKEQMVLALRKSANSAPFEVTIDEMHSYYCSCKHGGEFKRPRAHVLSVPLFVNNITPCRFDPWDLRWFGSFWHLQTWRSQYLYKIHRAGVSGTDLYQRDLIPGELSRKPGRKRVLPYKPSTSNSRRCDSCGLPGHYSKSCSSPNIVKIVESEEKRAKKSAENVIIDLTQNE